jgi:hypothetical protein
VRLPLHPQVNPHPLNRTVFMLILVMLVPLLAAQKEEMQRYIFLD